jgi:MinD-like ATPase involved in chromosome partitioning or flagellar assembly
MFDEHFVVLGVARPRTDWLTDLGRWATSSTIPVEFIRCISVDEVRSRLQSDRRHSAVLLDERCPGVDRDVIGAARDARCAPIVITGSPARRDWSQLGAVGTITEPVEPDSLLAALREHALGIERRSIPTPIASITNHQEIGRLVTVMGAGGTGTSTVAAAIATHAATARPAAGSVALVDASLDATQALIHDLGDVVPGLQELVELHRMTNPSPEDVRNHFWFSPSHGYDVLPGLRRHRDWSSIRRRAALAAIRSIRHSYAFVVADTDADLEGEPETGSIDIEDRNALARELTSTADVIVVTARPGIVGIHRLLHTLMALDHHGIAIERVLAVVIGAPRGTRDRSELTRTVTGLFAEVRPGRRLPTPVMVPIRRDLEPFLRDGAPLPRTAVGSITAAVNALLGEIEPASLESTAPIPIIPGHLGRTA